jgi:hypothetical protein
MIKGELATTSVDEPVITGVNESLQFILKPLALWLKTLIFLTISISVLESAVLRMRSTETVRHSQYHSKAKITDIPVLTKLTGYTEIKHKNGSYGIISKE